MSRFLKRDNKQGSFEFFNKHILYKSKVGNLKYPNIVNFTLAEKALYGKVDRNFLPIVYYPTNLDMKRFVSVAEPAVDQQAIAFVVDAFEALAMQFKKSVQVGKISKNDPFLSNLLVHKSFTPSDITYYNHFQTFKQALKQAFSNKDIRSFEDFTNHIERLLPIVTRSVPLSTPGFIKSRFNSLTNTGLSIEIADAAYENDLDKISQFVDSKNWEFYLNACNSYGFMIDMNAPWRLVADLDSEAMMGYASRYGFSTTTGILNVGFVTTHNTFFEGLPQMLLSLYNEMVPRHLIIETECGPESVARESYTITTLREQFDDAFFLDFYMRLRLTEDENTFTEAAKAKAMRETQQIAASSGTPTALRRFELFINQPFDYRGSMSYIINAEQL